MTDKGKPMPHDEVQPDEEVIDLDLKAEDSRLREAIGRPTSVRIDEVVIHIDHVSDWSATAMKAAVRGDWDTWAQEVIKDEDECNSFIDADLANYQLEAVFDKCANTGGVTSGKSKRSRRS